MTIGKFRNRFCFSLKIMGLSLLFAVVTVSSGLAAEWQVYQESYVKKVSELGGEEVKKGSLGITVIEIPELSIRDSCTTCHIAMNELRMFGEKNPLKPHPADYLEQHPPERFGCITCHGGQGDSLDEKRVHGDSFRKGDLAQISCSSCHTEVKLEGAPQLSNGKSLQMKNLCRNCHYAQNLAETEDFRPAPTLRGIGDKVSEKWLWRWLKDPKSYLQNARMPRYEIDEKFVDALIGYLSSSKDSRLDPEFDYPEGDIDKGKSDLRLSMCISCHPFNGKGGKEAPDLGRIGNKVEEKWLVQKIADPHLLQPNTPMPEYNLSPQRLSNIAIYLMDEFTDYDMLDEDEIFKLPSFWASQEERAEIGRRAYKELRCANCHGMLEETEWWRKIGPEFTLMGEKPLSEINFGESKIPRTRPDYIFEKIRNPQAYATPSNFMKMPKFDLADRDIKDIVLALLSFNSNKVKMAAYSFPKVEVEGSERVSDLIFDATLKVEETYHPAEAARKRYEPKGEFGRLVDKYRCFSCHSFKGRGYNITYDLTVEGSRVRRDWLFKYLKLPYSIRPILTIRMPIFNLTDEEAKVLSRTLSREMVDRKTEKDPWENPTAEMAEQGKKLFEERGCLACHQLGQKGGYVGPSLTQGAYVGEKLQAGWIFKWLKNSRAMKPDVLEPDYNLSDSEAQAVTAYLMSIKKPR